MPYDNGKLTLLEFKRREFGRRFPAAVVVMEEIVTLAVEEERERLEEAHANESWPEWSGPE